MRVCNRCGVEKPLSEYGKYRRYADGIHRSCKECVCLYSSKWRESNPEKELEGRKRVLAKKSAAAAERQAARAAKRALIADEVAAARKARALALARARYAENPQKFRDKCKRIREAVPGRGAEWKRRHRERYKDSIPHIVNKRMSNRLYKAITRGKAGKSWREWVDYSVEELLAHIERQFVKGMGWHNIGEWHIDHIVPLASFGAESVDSEEFRRAWALTNLRPMWGKDNMSKGPRVQTLL